MQHRLSISEILTSAKTVAIIGASSKAYRTSHHIMEYLMNQNFSVVPVNPNEQNVLGQKCFSSVIDIPDELSMDVMIIFRNKEYTAEMVQEIIRRYKKTGNKPVIWTQLDVSSPEAEALAQKEDIPYVKNRCVMVEHRAEK